MQLMLAAIITILKEVLKLLWNDASIPVAAAVAPAVPRRMRDAFEQRVLDKIKKSSLH
jgi:hypothetical protein